MKQGQPRQNVKGCLYPGCNGKHRTRGLCNNHYIAALGLVRAGLTTWAKLEAEGKSRVRKVGFEIESASHWFLNEPNASKPTPETERKDNNEQEQQTGPADQ